MLACRKRKLRTPLAYHRHGWDHLNEETNVIRQFIDLSESLMSTVMIWKRYSGEVAIAIAAMVSGLPTSSPTTHA